MVVTTIVIILAALLAAAADKTLYEATLARCLADQRSISIGVISYAGAHRKFYPHRPGVWGDPGWAPNLLHDDMVPVDPAAGVGKRRHDDRPILHDFLSINGHFNCPLVQPVELAETGRRTRVMASQALWAGWRYESAGHPLKGMVKLGDRFEWDGMRFSLLVSDWTAFSRDDNFAIGSHPDFYDGIMHLESVEDRQTSWWVPSPLTYSFWVTPETSWPGPVDRTFLYDDGSGHRLVRVSWRAATDATGKLLRKQQVWERVDERTVRVPERVHNDPSRSTHLPRE
jgi:hypothetical protein